MVRSFFGVFSAQNERVREFLMHGTAEVTSSYCKTDPTSFISKWFITDSCVQLTLFGGENGRHNVTIDYSDVLLGDTDLCPSYYSRSLAQHGRDSIVPVLQGAHGFTG